MQNYTNNKLSFAIIYSSLLDADWNSAIKEVDKVVFSKLLVRYRGSCANSPKYKDEHGIYLVYPIEQVAADCNISDSTAKRSLNNLAKLGYINKIKSGGMANRIYITNPILTDDVLLGLFKVSKIGTIAPAEDGNRAYYINDSVILEDIGGLGMNSCMADESYFENYNLLFEDKEEVVSNCTGKGNMNSDTVSEVKMTSEGASEVILTPKYYTPLKSSNNYSITNNQYNLSSNTILNTRGLEGTDLSFDTPHLLSDSSKKSSIANFRERVEADFFVNCHIGVDGEKKNAMAQYIITICEKLLCATYPIAYKDMQLSSLDIDALFEKAEFDYMEIVLERVVNADMKHPFSYIRSTIIDVLMAGETLFEYSLKDTACSVESLEEEGIAETKVVTCQDEMQYEIEQMLGKAV